MGIILTSFIWLDSCLLKVISKYQKLDVSVSSRALTSSKVDINYYTTLLQR